MIPENKTVLRVIMMLFFSSYLYLMEMHYRPRYICLFWERGIPPLLLCIFSFPHLILRSICLGWGGGGVCAGFPCSSAGKESACTAGNSGLIPGLGRSAGGEEIGYPLQYSWASLVAQTVKNPPAMQETWVWSLGGEDPLEEGMATHSSILAWRISMDWGAWRATVRGVTKSQTQLSE